MVSLTGLTICLLFQVYLAEVVALTVKVVAAAVNLEFFEVELPRGLRPPAEVGPASLCRRGVGILAPPFASAGPASLRRQHLRGPRGDLASPPGQRQKQM